MYAIVKTGGKQYRVQPGQRLLVERLRAAEGETVSLQPVMCRADEVICDAEALAGVSVSAMVLAHERGPKLRVFKFKPKRGYRRRTGHRQELTRIEVTDIAVGGGGKAARAKSAPARSRAAKSGEPAAARSAKAAATAPADETEPKAPPADSPKTEEGKDGS